MAKGPPSPLLRLLPIIILGFLNLIAAGFLAYFVAQDFTRRLEWARAMDALIAFRDGIKTEDLMKNLSQEERQKVEQWLSDYARRKAAGAALLEPLKDKPGEINKEETQKLAKDLNYSDYQRLLHEIVKLRSPELSAEEKRLAEAKDTLLQVRQKYNDRIQYLQTEIARLASKDQRPEELLQREKAAKAKADAENQERRRELALVTSELEEAVAARQLSEGLQRDLEAQLQRTRELLAQYLKENEALARQITQLEGATTTTTSRE